MEQAYKIFYHGHRYQVDIVKEMIRDEIKLYEKRLEILKRASLSGQEKLVTSYQEMIDARVDILNRLNEMKNG